ncbi:hypothetical protein Trco_005318 [Trichoderma cornu-damae]|uniref:Acetyl-CoA synthetase-like protein n=1 Tax=Trichoderma cornu-damae TaxID=654480 RepID=A0A9P8QMS9_9HYPO|nr:hypothetical protein Trco_005318 [Trichoderma cornu-damae]
MAQQEDEIASAPDTAIAEIHGEPLADLDQRLWDILAATASAHPDREAMVSLWQPADASQSSDDPNPTARSECLRWSYRNLRDKAERLADVLEKLGVGPGMHVAAALWNCAEWSLFFWASAKIGAAFVPIDPRVTDDFAFMLESAAPRVLVVQDAGIATQLAKGDLSFPDGVLRIRCGSDVADGWLGLHELLARDFSCQGNERLGDTGDDQGPPRANGMRGSDGDTPALIVFTSGTTGKPKGCPHTNSNLVSQTNNYDPNVDTSFVDRWLVHTPVCHVFAINNALRAWRHGGTVVFAAKSFHIDATLKALVQEKCTVMSATPTLVKALLSHSSFPSPRDLNLSIVSISGTIIGPEHMQLCREGLGARDAIQAYGMSEGAPIISWSRQDGMLVDGYHPGVGKVLAGAAVRVCRQGSRHVLCRMEVGELHIAGPSVISNYLGACGSEEEKFYSDESGRWLKTGDQAMIDNEGVVYILGRYNDLIIRGGENINPLKVEHALSEIPGLVQVFVVGVADDVAGQIPVAVAKLSPEVSKMKLMEKARSLGPQYVLDAVYTFEDLGLESVPATSIGKPKRAVLAGIVADHRRTSQAEGCPEVGKGGEVAILEERLSGIWDQLVGVRPGSTDDIFCLADSITLLRYCDAVLRIYGRRLYLQDLSRCNTVGKQAQLLASRDAPTGAGREMDGNGIVRVCPTDSDDGSIARRGQRHSNLAQRPILGHEINGSLLAAAQEQVERLGLDGSDVEDVVPIRGSMYRTVVGQRPQSYCIRVVFRVHNAAASEIYDGLLKWLASKPLLRAVLLSARGLLYHAVVRHSPPLFRKLVREIVAETEKEAKELSEDGFAGAHSPMSMFSAAVIKVEETGRYLLRLTYNHSVVDALTLLSWHRDIDWLIHNSNAVIPAQTPYRLFADLWSEYQDSLPAQRAVSFHARRLRGISRYGDALWPKQRSPGMMIAGDEDSFYFAERQAARDRIWDGEWRVRAHEFRFPRRSRIVRLPNMVKMRDSFNLEPAPFTKCALALFNILQTRSSVALFSSWESARSWPFVPDWISNALQPAMSIDGPTVGWILNMFQVDSDETLADFIRRMVLEQEQATRHEHVPWEKVVQELREEGDAATDASFRQSFVWDVSMGVAASRGFRSDFDTLEPVARYDWPDCGLFWSAFMVDRDNLFFIASWDTAQLNAEEVDEYCDDLADVMRSLANEDNWSLKVGDVFSVH